MPAPMPGMIVSYEKNVGDAVSEGETVLILEAMKMENALAAPAEAPKAAPAPPPAAAADADGTPLTAPMPGMIVKYEKGVGDSVEKGETVLILEAMKMENALPAPVSGTIKAVNFSSGDSVAKNAVLAVIG